MGANAGIAGMAAQLAAGVATGGLSTALSGIALAAQTYGAAKSFSDGDVLGGVMSTFGAGMGGMDLFKSMKAVEMGTTAGGGASMANAFGGFEATPELFELTEGAAKNTLFQKMGGMGGALSLASGGIGALGALQEASFASNQAKMSARYADIDGLKSRNAGELKALKALEAKNVSEGLMVARLGASGTTISSGSAQSGLRSAGETHDFNIDMARSGGIADQLSHSARAESLRVQADSATSQGYLSAGGSLFSGALGAYKHKKYNDMLEA